MGTAFELAVVSEDSAFANQQLVAGVSEIQRIEEILTEFKDHSLTSLINQNAGVQSISVTSEFIQLLERSVNISKLTKGFFDITIGPLKGLYNFKQEKFTFPSKTVINDQLQKIGFEKIEWSSQNSTAYLTKSGMKISFAAIGKGYAADMVVKMWKQNGLPSGYVNASGDLTAFGQNEKGEAWKVGIADPDHTKKSLFNIPLDNLSLATSGDYEQYFSWNGIKYSHNLNPLTGLPIQDLASVSVVSPSAELSDALATAISAMGIKKGLNFVDQLPHTHAIIIDSDREVYMSKNLKYENIG